LGRQHPSRAQGLIPRDGKRGAGLDPFQERFDAPRVHADVALSNARFRAHVDTTAVADADGLHSNDDIVLETVEQRGGGRLDAPFRWHCGDNRPAHVASRGQRPFEGLVRSELTLTGSDPGVGFALLGSNVRAAVFRWIRRIGAQGQYRDKARRVHGIGSDIVNRRHLPCPEQHHRGPRECRHAEQHASDA